MCNFPIKNTDLVVSNSIVYRTRSAVHPVSIFSNGWFAFKYHIV